MKVKSEFSGTCQICGCVQKLPNGKLSNHGYTKRWGFFTGTCTGSKELPYEQSCELVKASIVSATQQKKAHVHKAAQLDIPLTEATEEEMHFTWNFRVRGGWGDRKVAIAKICNGRIVPVTDDPTLVLEYSSMYGIYGQTELEAFNSYRSYQAKSELRMAQRLAEYIEFQTARVNEWKLSDLIPVKK